MIVFPNCKINLGLHILRKRADGFHDIETCFYPIMWTDILEIISPTNTHQSESFVWSQSGIAIVSSIHNNSPLALTHNIVYKAYQLIHAEFNLPPLQVHLHKTIPMGAGLGGGSSDAAFFINTVNTHFGLNMSIGQRKKIAAQLGSDCAFFIENKPLFASGKGDELESIDINLKGKHIIVIHPNIHSDTKLAYAGVKPDANKPSLRTLLLEPINKWKDCIYNDFEQSIAGRFPEILTVKEELYKMGAIYAAMSGSGSSIFGIFDQNTGEIPYEWNEYSVYRGILGS
jgi:4-diphosphocytidyl-2-C-methyl-D-erythritol kinase